MLENVQPNWNETNETKDDFIKGKPSLAAVATTGAYSDLSGKPVLDNVATDLRKTPLCVTIADPTSYNGVRWHRSAPTSGSHSGVYYDFNLEYSTDLVTWTAMTWTDDVTNTLYLGTHADSIGNKVYFRGENLFIYSAASQYGWLNFQCTETASTSNAVDLSGNLYSIVWKTDFASQTSLASRATGYPVVSFMRLFYNNSTGYQCNIRHAKDLQLPALTLVANAYGYMFGYNANLLSAPELPATTLAQGCYVNMFAQCSSLTQAPSVLPAETLVSGGSYTTGCYASMFSGCTSLVKAPKILATTLVTNSAYRMFYACTALKEVETIFMSWGNNATADATTTWLPNNSGVGNRQFRCTSYLPMDTRDADHVPSTWSVVYSEVWKSELDKLDPTEYFAITALESGSLTLTPASGVTIEYKHPDASGWGTYASGVSLMANVTYYFRNTSDTAVAFCDGTNPGIQTASKFKVSGDITTLLRKTGGVVTPPESAFAKLFSGCTTLVDASDLKMARGTSASCYSQMFYGCSALAGAPKLPALYAADSCYYQMFYNCSSLVTPPELPSTTVGYRSYYQMFYNCTALKRTPLVLPATTLGDGCYYGMFYKCTSLTQVPDKLPATTLTTQCYYQMLAQCSSLKEVGISFLPATTMAERCYSFMFQSCQSLTGAPASLSATTLAEKCYQGMFSNCYNLRVAPVINATAYTGTLCCDQMFANSGVRMVKSNVSPAVDMHNSASSGSPKCIYIVPDGTDATGLPSNITAVANGNWQSRSVIAPEGEIKTSTAATYGVSPGNAIGVVTVDSALTLSASGSWWRSQSGTVRNQTIEYAELVIDLAVGATVTAGANLTFADTLTAGKRNICVVRFTIDGGTLYVTALEDLPASE